MRCFGASKSIEKEKQERSASARNIHKFRKMKYESRWWKKVIRRREGRVEWRVKKKKKKKNKYIKGEEGAGEGAPIGLFSELAEAPRVSLRNVRVSR